MGVGCVLNWTNPAKAKTQGCLQLVQFPDLARYWPNKQLDWHKKGSAQEEQWVARHRNSSTGTEKVPMKSHPDAIGILEKKNEGIKNIVSLSKNRKK